MYTYMCMCVYVQTISAFAFSQFIVHPQSNNKFSSQTETDCMENVLSGSIV